jgi:hypothetical protein
VTVNSFGLYGGGTPYVGGYGGPLVSSGGGESGLIAILLLGVVAVFLFSSFAGNGDSDGMVGKLRLSGCLSKIILVPYFDGITDSDDMFLFIGRLISLMWLE